jgi:hypothetical protein
MYSRDMPLMRDHALSSPEGLTDIVAFVLCTIRQPLQSVKRQMTDIRAHGAEAASLFGSKRDGYRYALEHAPVLHAAIVAAVASDDTIGAIDVLSNIPGLGIVKAAFVAQICGLEVACLDGHNLARLGLGEAAFKLAKSVKPETKRRKIADYVKACRDASPIVDFARYWWDSWCEYVAGNKANRSLASADAVSAYHWECIAA